MRIMRHGRPGPPQSRLSDAALLAARSRAAELLIAAAAHRISVEHWLAKQQIKQQQIKQQQTAVADMKLTLSPEMIEAWMTAEDAVEVAGWHMKAGQGDTCALASSAFEAGFAAAFMNSRLQAAEKAKCLGAAGGAAPKRKQAWAADPGADLSAAVSFD